MQNPLSSFSDLPKPIMVVALLASGATIGSVVMAIRSDHPGWKIAAGGLIALGLIMVIFKLVLMLRDKGKSSPFTAMLTRGGGQRAAADPASKARMDDLRKKFEEGVSTFKGAGKDLYSLPWFLLVGPSGSGKTEALRHSNVGFPQGLQDCLQGTGGTLNMHWWFTNHAVVLDTAGRMFMEEAGEGQSTEWKEFLKLLKAARPNCPVNGLLLVISSETLLRDSADKIEKTAGAIARQMDLIQRTLEVRFPVTVVVTKCDKIIGFREFFEGINDPALQHQILGWSNPASLDEAFKPDGVEKHLAGVRERLMKRRAGMMQNPVHSMDPNGRRTDEIDELFELPDNLVRIAPRLRRYLELIFVAGEWSPKPLFLRGIYFTSSMREGQALDVTLAAALGVDVESLPKGKEYDKEKAYFLRDVFLGKVFKERGLVTRAQHVGKHLARRRAWIVGGSLAATLLIGLVTVFSYLGYRDSLGPPSEFWKSALTSFARHAADVKEGKARPLTLFEHTPEGEFTYVGDQKPGIVEGLAAEVSTRSDLIAATADHTTNISLGWAGAPAKLVLEGFSGESYGQKQTQAHRAVLESTTLVPLLQRVREKLQKEQDWDDAAVRALAQLVRLHTLAEGAAPSDNPPPASGAKPSEGWSLVDVNALCEYALGRAAYQDMKGPELKKIADAVAKAYPDGWPKAESDRGSESLFNSSRELSWTEVSRAKDLLLKKLAEVTPGGDSDLGRLALLCRELDEFDKVEQTYEGALAFLPAGAGAPGEADARNTEAGYGRFAEDYTKKVESIGRSQQKVADAASKFKPEELNDTKKMLDGADKAMRKEISDRLAVLRAQLPAEGSAGPADLAKLSAELNDKTATSLAAAALAAVSRQVDETRQKLDAVSYLLTAGRVDQTDQRLYEARAIGHKLAGAAVAEAKPIERAEGAASGFIPNLAKVNEALTVRDGRFNAQAAWAGSGLTPEQSKLQRSVAVARTASALAAGRARWACVDAAMRDPCWASGKEVAAEAEQVALRLIAEEKIRKDDRKRPQVPLSEMDGKVSEYDPRYLPEAGGAMLRAWDDIEALLATEGSAGPLVVARGDLAKLPRLSEGRRAAEQYAALYIAYWRDQATIAARPNARTWDEFCKRIKDMGEREITEPLDALRARCAKALDDLPAKLAKKQDLEDAKADVSTALKDAAGKSGREFVKEAVLDKWKPLCAGTPSAARDSLMRACREGKLSERYFEGFIKSGKPGHILYLNQLLLNGMSTLVEASGGDLDRAWGELTRARAVPLAVGSSTLPNLSPAQVEAARAAVRTVGGAAGAPAGESGCSKSFEDREMRELVSRLAGEGYLKDEATQKWFAKVQGVLKALEKPVKISIAYKPGGGVALAGATDASGIDSPYLHARLFVDDKPVGKMFSFNVPSAEDREAIVSVPGSASIEMRLYRQDPNNEAAKENNPDGKIVLGVGPGGEASPWGPLRDFLTEAGDNKPQDGRWIVLARTADGRHFLPLTLKFEDAAAIPPRTDWPTEAEWAK